jgi:putative colanic acid biosynthesis glycosyltransferase
MPRIVQINTVVSGSSTATICKIVGDQFYSEGWASHIFYGRGDSKKDHKSESWKFSLFFEVYFDVFISRIIDVHSVFSNLIGTTRLMIRLIRLKPEVIVLHNLHGYYINIPFFFYFLNQYKRRRVVRISLVLHDCWPFTGHCTYFTSISCNKFTSSCSNCPQLSSYPTSYFLDNSTFNWRWKKFVFTSGVVNEIISPSKWLSVLVRNSFLSNIKVEVINNGIQDKVVDDKVSEKIQSDFIILGVANQWIDRKGFKDFLELRRILDSKYKIVLIGDYNKNFIIPDGIIMIGKVSQSELVKYFCNSSVYVNLTYEDNFPLTNIEALSHGLPVISYNSGGSCESIGAECGFCVPTGDLKALVQAIDSISNSDINYKINCRTHYLKFYTAELMARRYFNYLTK